MLKDRLFVDHPTFGTITVYLIYEKLGRVCTCCGGIRHKISGCDTYVRILQLANDPLYSNRTEIIILKEKQNGAWINVAGLVPRPQELTTGLQEDGNQNGFQADCSPHYYQLGLGQGSEQYRPQHYGPVGRPNMAADLGMNADEGMGFTHREKRIQHETGLNLEEAVLTDLVISEPPTRRHTVRRAKAAAKQQKGKGLATG